ncbi:DMT family transporter [Alkalimonas sp. MEB108]|uniref:DMT family transporter n=1 Tax=Alkalimonas cellulosilytica TaxID=3058395 RepID=A0ABU7J0T3_9GAMM|nr:DMT family transporter [Alkalimonas sp. MEB108]MEE2000104.1 DMT family transporter [Alkalimonas sp. MEB108]
MTGEIAALLTACCWALAARLYRHLGASFNAISLNFWKGLISLLVLLPLGFLLPATELTTYQQALLLLSGAIGIGLGDTFFFLALRRLGDRQCLLVAETLAPLITALLAMLWLSEWLLWQHWLGMALIFLAVERVLRAGSKSSDSPLNWSGLQFAALAALCQAIGAVISRDIFLHTEISVLQASNWRFLGGMAIILVLMLLWRQRPLPRPAFCWRPWLVLLAAALVGTTAAMLLQMLAFSHTKAAIAQTLLATSIVLSLLLTKLLGDAIPTGSIRWTLAALLGVGLLLA